MLSYLTEEELQDLRAKAENSLRDQEDECYDYIGTQWIIGAIDQELRRRMSR